MSPRGRRGVGKEAATKRKRPAGRSDQQPTKEELLARVAQLEQQRSLERESLLALVNSLPDDVFFVNAEGKVVFANDVVRESLGLPAKDEVLGILSATETRFEVLKSDGTPRQPEESPLLLAFRGEVVRGEEMIRHRETGELRHRHYQVVPVRVGGRVAGAVSLVRDITAYKETEARLAYLASFPERNPNPIVETDTEGRVRYANPTAQRLFPDLGERGRAHPWLAGWAELAASMRDSGTTVTERTVVVGDRVYAQVLSYWAERRLLRGYGLDITERRRAEEAASQSQRTLSELVERAPFGMYIVDSELRIAYMNRATQENAFRNVRPLIGRGFDETMHTLWPDAVAEEIIGHFRHTLETGEPYFSPRFVNPRADVDAVEAYEWELHRMTLPDGQHGVVCYYFDSTQIRAAEGELRRLADDLREADRRKDHFLAVLSHELRNPLTPIRNSLHILGKAAPGGEQAKRAHAVIERQISHLARLVDDLLDATRIASGKLQIRRERLELGELVRRAVEDHRTVFAETGVALAASVTTRPAWVHGDPARLSQAVGNLLQNAAKFTPAGGHVEASLTVADGTAVLQVVDAGMGIAPEMLERLFEPFVQAEQTLDRRLGGLGLGLALAKTVIEQQGGSIEAASDGLARGATFTVRLPLAAPEDREDTTSPPAARRRRRILVIEDNVDAAESLRDVLELGGHIVAVAYGGAEGLQTAHEFLPEVVLCDIGLPEMDGHAVARAFRADEALRSAFLVALTGYALPDDIVKAREAGFDLHLAKPASIKDLEGALGDAGR